MQSSVYRPPSASSDWIDALNCTDYRARIHPYGWLISMNTKWKNLIQLFDLPQLVTSPTRVSQSSSTIIDHVYTSNPENITEAFVPYYAISDNFPVCLSRKVNAKISKPEHITTSYRCFKKYDETLFLNDLSIFIEYLKSDQEPVDEDFAPLLLCSYTMLGQARPH